MRSKVAIHPLFLAAIFAGKAYVGQLWLFWLAAPDFGAVVAGAAPYSASPRRAVKGLATPSTACRGARGLHGQPPAILGAHRGNG
jgi:hypothetical protein